MRIAFLSQKSMHNRLVLNWIKMRSRSSLYRDDLFTILQLLIPSWYRLQFKYTSRFNLLRSLHVCHRHLAPRNWLKIPRKQNKSHLPHSDLAQIPSKKKKRAPGSLRPGSDSKIKKETKQKTNAPGPLWPGLDTKEKKEEHLAHSNLAQIPRKKKESTWP